MKDLLDIRKDIDKIDEQIVKLYEERMKLTSDVAEYKINTGKQVFDKEREESKLATLQKKAESDFTRHGIRELFEQIMAMSRKKQYKLLTEHGIMPPQEFEPIHTLDYSNARIVFQGLEGAYSQLAMEQFFGENCLRISSTSFLFICILLSIFTIEIIHAVCYNEIMGATT